MQKGGSGAGESNANRYQTWVTAPFGSPVTMSAGNATVFIWTAIRDFDTDKGGSVAVYLREAGAGTICQGSLTDPDWHSSANWRNAQISLVCPAYTIPAGGRLELKVIITSQSDDDMWLAYDTVPYQSRVSLP